MIRILKISLVVFVVSWSNVNAQKFEITNLKVSSEKNYLVKFNGFDNDSLQYIDRNYLFARIPDELKVSTLIMVAGNDKMYEEHEVCFSFNVNKKVIVHVLYADVFTVLPDWLKKFKKTNKKVYRHDSSEETMKGIFTVYSKKFPAGNIQINGCLGKGMKTPEFVERRGGGFCMYSVVIEELEK